MAKRASRASRKLGLKPAPVSTQVVQRDRHAEYFATLAILAASVEKFAVEIRTREINTTKKVVTYRIII